MKKSVHRILIAVLAPAILLLCSACDGSGGTSESRVPESEPSSRGTLVIQNGAMLERDIIPQMERLFDLTKEEIAIQMTKGKESKLIAKELTGVRRLEGVFVPGSYEITQNEDFVSWVNQAITKAEERYERAVAEAQNSNQLSVTDRLKLASMVEAEALHGDSKEEVAAVFLNRLGKNMPLQSCVTAEYALGFQRPFLTGKDVEIQSPYNTYYVKALPEGPICSFDDASLLAATGVSENTELTFFFYDYLENKLYFYSDYGIFKKEANASRNRYIEQTGKDPNEKIDKQKSYGRQASAEQAQNSEVGL